MRKRKGWGIKWRDYLMADARCMRPVQFAGYSTMVFATRQEAREHAKPYGGAVKVVPVLVSVKEARA